MSQPVKLSDQLVLDARTMSAHAKRSIAGQIEFWAGLGRAMEVEVGSPRAALRRIEHRQPMVAMTAKRTPVNDPV